MKQIAAFWKSISKPEYQLGWQAHEERFMLSSKGESPFSCFKCNKGSLIWLQACIVPQSQYGLWCDECHISLPISHLHLWPYIEEEYAKSKGVSIDELRQQKRRTPSKSVDESPDNPRDESEHTEASTGS